MPSKDAQTHQKGATDEKSVRALSALNKRVIKVYNRLTFPFFVAPLEQYISYLVSCVGRISILIEADPVISNINA